MTSTGILYQARQSALCLLLLLLGCAGTESSKSQKGKITLTDREHIQQILQSFNKPLQCVVHREGFDYYLPTSKCGELRDLAQSLLRSKSLVYKEIGSFSAGPDNVLLFEADRKRF